MVNATFAFSYLRPQFFGLQMWRLPSLHHMYS